MIKAKQTLKGTITIGKPLSVVEMSEIEGGHKIKVTDPNGTQEINIMDGAKGDKGDKGDKGKDAEIVCKDRATGNPIFIDDVSPIEHELQVKADGATAVSRIGANFWNMDNILSVEGNVINNNNGSLTFKSHGVASGINLKNVCPQLKVGHTVVLNFDTTGSEKYIYLYGANVAWKQNTTKTITQEMLDSVLVFYADKSADGKVTEVVASNFIVSLNDTDFEPYREVQTVEVVNGTATGLTSVYPNMTLIADTGTIECVYNLDLKKHIDRKLAELVKEATR